MGSRGMYLNKWTPNFNLENEIPYVIPVCVPLPSLPLHRWNDETVEAIGNSHGRYIDIEEPRDGIYACAHIVWKLTWKRASGKLWNCH
jgi:hypothetical protein